MPMKEHEGYTYATTIGASVGQRAGSPLKYAEVAHEAIEVEMLEVDAACPEDVRALPRGRRQRRLAAGFSTNVGQAIAMSGCEWLACQGSGLTETLCATSPPRTLIAGQRCRDRRCRAGWGGWRRDGVGVG